MTIYESLPAIALAANNALDQTIALPELVHLDDPALNVMIDFKRIIPVMVSPKEPIDNALNEMKISGVSVLLVVNKDKQVIGLISGEDILGEKPIKFMQERHLSRSDILVRMVMTPQEKLSALDFEGLKHAKVANIVNTLQELRQHYLLVVHSYPNESRQTIRGIFSSSQISKQLHQDIITNALGEAHSLAELQKRQKY